jgi:hypothetical protein
VQGGACPPVCLPTLLRTTGREGLRHRILPRYRPSRWLCTLRPQSEPHLCHSTSSALRGTGVVFQHHYIIPSSIPSRVASGRNGCFSFSRLGRACSSPCLLFFTLLFAPSRLGLDDAQDTIREVDNRIPRSRGPGRENAYYPALSYPSSSCFWLLASRP